VAISKVVLLLAHPVKVAWMVHGLLHLRPGLSCPP
jgi:hypothetical protein